MLIGKERGNIGWVLVAEQARGGTSSAHSNSMRVDGIGRLALRPNLSKRGMESQLLRNGLVPNEMRGGSKTRKQRHAKLPQEQLEKLQKIQRKGSLLFSAEEVLVFLLFF